MFDYELNLKYKKIIAEQAKLIINKLIDVAIEEFQKVDIESGCLLSCEDSGLKNLWDEICVDIQGEHSTFHFVYVEMIETFIHNTLIPCLSELDKKILWLQTDDFSEWLEQTEEEYNCNKQWFDIPVPVASAVDAIEQYIFDCILQEAMNYSNARIEKFLYR